MDKEPELLKKNEKPGLFFCREAAKKTAIAEIINEYKGL